MKLNQRETGKTGVMRACLDLLEAERIRHWRMNSGSFLIHDPLNKKARRIRGHAKGTPDILAAVRVGNSFEGHPTFLWLEVKVPGKHPTPEQLQFADDARINGELHLFVYDAKELQIWLRENRAR